MRFLKSKEKKQLLEELKEIYGITNLPYLMIESGKKRIRGFSGHLSKEEISHLSSLINVELIGFYLISKKDDDARLNFDSLPLLKDQITKRILAISKEQLELWIRGNDLDVKKIPRGIVVLKHQDDLVGIGKSNEEKIFNYVPKERKLKTKLN